MTGYPCCCYKTVDCDFCTDGWPTNWTVEIAGYTSASCDGGNCTDLNATYVVNDETTTDTNECRTAENFNGPCNYNNLFVYINKSGLDYILNVDYGGAPTLEIWQKNLGTTKPDCTTFSGEVCTITGTASGSCSAVAGSSTATVTAN
jgi:hypothetical protein